MKKCFLTLLISLVILTGCESNKKEESKKIVENNGMLSYTIDGEKTDIKPTKEDGYIVNKIICDNGSDMMWDNDNWEVELTKVNSKDRCKVDFTKDTNKEGYRVTVTSNVTSALDSLSKATTLNGTIKIYSKSKIKNVTGCNGNIEDNKVIVSNVNSNQTCNIIVEQTLADAIKTLYPSSGVRVDFSAAYITTALHTATDYDKEGNFSGTTYYFTGNPNNWISFAGKLWRIIRINGNGSVRLLYAGTGSTDGYLTDVGKTTYSINSSTYNHPAYVGWKYTASGSSSGDRGNSTESGAYKAVSSWYTTNITNVGLTDYIDTEAIYCNDRSIGRESYSTSSDFYYGGYTRLITNKAPTLKCSDSADRFTTFGLMTADEVAYAGGVYGNNNSSAYYYLNASGESSTAYYVWCTITPSYFSVWNDVGWAGGFNVNGYGRLDSGHVANDFVIRPVISLKKEVQVTSGDGSAESPYEVTL